MEPLRDESFILGEEIPWSQVMAICMLILGLAMLAWILYTNRKKEGKYFGSATGDPYGITKYIGDSKDEVAYLTNINMMCKIYPENYSEKPEEKKSSFFKKKATKKESDEEMERKEQQE